MNPTANISNIVETIELEDHVLTPDGLACVLDIDEGAGTARVIHNSVYSGSQPQTMKDYTVDYPLDKLEKVQEWVIAYESQYSTPGSFPQIYAIRETTKSKVPQLLASIKAKRQADYAETCKAWTPEAWQAQFNAPLRDTSGTVQAMTWPEFYLMQREHILGNSKLRMETYREFMDALEVLPPEQWQSDADLGFERFLMSEYWTGSYTTQHACVTHQGKHICASRMVDARDKSTWITRDDVMAAHEAGEVAETLFSEKEINDALIRIRKEGLNWDSGLGFEQEYNSFLLAACIEVIDEESTTRIERVDEVYLEPLFADGKVNEVFWTIYAYKVDGECAAICDLRTKEEAEQVYNYLCSNLADPYNF